MDAITPDNKITRSFSAVLKADGGSTVFFRDKSVSLPPIVDGDAFRFHLLQQTISHVAPVHANSWVVISLLAAVQKSAKLLAFRVR